MVACHVWWERENSDFWVLELTVGATIVDDEDAG